jgi:two-component system sensor histidine kinase/response regulator
LFRVFGKLKQDSSLNDNGVGLGLNICKKISESLGGMITLGSSIGIGSNFTFYIKLRQIDNSEHLDIQSLSD